MRAEDALPALVHAIDRLDWTLVRERFADTVDVDYSELSGQRQGAVSADDLIAQWEGMLPGFVSTQHLLGPVVATTDGDLTRIDAHVRAWHQLPADTWTVAGHYEGRVDADGRIVALTLRVFRVGGPEDAPAQAAARIAGGDARQAASPV